MIKVLSIIQGLVGKPIYSRSPVRYTESYDLADLDGNDLITKSHLIQGAGDEPLKVTILAGATVPVNIDLTGYNFGTNPTIVATQKDTTSREKLIYDLTIFYNFTNTSKTTLASIDVSGHDNGSGSNLDEIYITIKK